MEVKDGTPFKNKGYLQNGVIEPLDEINLPEGQALEVEIKTLPSATSELSLDQKRALIKKTPAQWKAHGGVLLKRLMPISSQKGNHGIESFRFQFFQTLTAKI